jgi:hypothetical protein
MTILGLIRVGAACAQAAVDAEAHSEPGADATVLRLGVLEFLRLHAGRLEAAAGDRDLLDAYQAWLEIAVAFYSSGNQELVPDYVRRGSLLTAEFDLAQARAEGRLGAAEDKTTA